MKVEVALPTLRNLIKLFDHDNNNKISLSEFAEQMEKFLDRKSATSPPVQPVPPEEVKKVKEEEKKEEIKK